MNIFNYFKKQGIDTVDPSFYRKIEEWISWYEGNVRNFSFYKVYSGRGTYKRCRRKSMGMAKKLSEDIADLLLNERVTITLDDDQTNEYVQQVLNDNRFLVMGNDYQERKAFTDSGVHPIFERCGDYKGWRSSLWKNLHQLRGCTKYIPGNME